MFRQYAVLDNLKTPEAGSNIIEKNFNSWLSVQSKGTVKESDTKSKTKNT